MHFLVTSGENHQKSSNPINIPLNFENQKSIDRQKKVSFSLELARDLRKNIVNAPTLQIEVSKNNLANLKNDDF